MKLSTEVVCELSRRDVQDAIKYYLENVKRLRGVPGTLVFDIGDVGGTLSVLGATMKAQPIPESKDGRR